MKHTRRLGWSLGALTATLVVGGSLASAGPAPEERTPPVKRVRVERVELATETRSVRFAGVIRAADRADLSFPLGARLAERPVEVGEEVRAGQVLARLDSREMANAVDTAVAAVAEIAANRERLGEDRARAERLFAAKAATREEVDRTRRAEEALVAAGEAAESRLREARRLLGETRLTAPFAATVTRVSAEPGEFVRPGQHVVTLSGRAGFEVEVGLPESMAAGLAKGQEVVVELPLAGGRVLNGRVDRVGRASEVGGGLFPAVIALAPEPGLLAGMTAEVSFEVGGASSGLVALPLAAVLNPGGQRPEVFRLEGERVRRVPVEVRSLVGERVAVRADLEPGAEVVVTGHTSLLDGDRVEVIR